IGGDPRDGLASAKVEDVRAASEGVGARARARVGPLKAPAPREAEFLGAAEHEVDDGLRIAGRVIANPKLGAAVLGLDGKEERIRGWILRGVLLHHARVEVEGARGVLRRADIEKT